jgi:predicted permease
VKLIRRFFKRLTAWARMQADEERLRLEIEEHLAQQTSENVRAGMAAGDARRQAMLKFGSVESVRESFRDEKGLPLLETLLLDIRHAVMRLRRAPTFTLAAILTLALGIGATTSIFTLIHAVLFKSLAVANPSELYRLGRETHCCEYIGYQQYKEFSIVSYDLYKHFRDNTKGFAELAAFQAGQSFFGVRRSGHTDAAQSYPGEFVSGNYFAMFGVGAYAGRMLTASDDQPNAPPVVVMSYRLWQQRYGADEYVVGGVFTLDGKPFTVIGITPPSFFGDALRGTPPDLFVPLAMEPLVQDISHIARKDDHWLDLIGRVRPGASSSSVEAQMRVELKQWLRAHWGEMTDYEHANFRKQTLYLSPGGAGITSMREDYEHWLQILMTVTGFVLLIVCANVANLMLVRGMEQRQQTALSMALGARASRLIQQALTESVLLSLFGGVAGLAVAFAGTYLILYFVFPPFAGMGGVPISASPSLPVLAFTFGVSLITGILFGIAPAWMATRVDPIEALRGASRSTAKTGSVTRKALVVVQAALSLVLLSASGLLTITLRNLEDQHFGFEQERRTVVNVDPLLAGYKPKQLTPLYRRIHDSLAALPGVGGVALCLYSPQSGDSWDDSVTVDEHPAPVPNDDNEAHWSRVTPEYFEVIGNPIVRGRGITDEDTAISRPVAVINEAFARHFFKNENPIGKHFGSRHVEIVGIARDERHLTFNLDKPIGPFFFLPEAQYATFPNPADTKSDLFSHYLHDVVIVTKPGAKLSAAQVRSAIASVDRSLPVIWVRTLRDQVVGQFNQQRLIARLTSFFGLLSLLLASVGVYGVTAYNAGRRVSEIGVRMALGAVRRDVVALILRGAFVVILYGLLVGLPGTFAVGRFLGTQLYGMNPYNPRLTLSAVAALGFTSLIASLIPALRASLISPSEALRAE